MLSLVKEKIILTINDVLFKDRYTFLDVMFLVIIGNKLIIESGYTSLNLTLFVLMGVAWHVIIKNTIGISFNKYSNKMRKK